jgi:hypothetical protein
LYFTSANPAIFMGGFFGEHKDEILDLIPDEYKVKSIHITSNDLTRLESIINEQGFGFPLIVKPNVGERGFGVKKIYLLEELYAYSKEFEDFLIQEFVDYPLELGVLYSQLPDDTRGVVSSICEKKFIRILGDGKSSAEELVRIHPRHRLYLNVILEECPENLQKIPAKGQDYVVYEIGNHAKGTQFLDANNYLGDEIDDVFNKINNRVEGVYFGRYDLKVPSYEDLKLGRNIKVFELNGVSSEPGHIYDQSNVFKAYSELKTHWLRIIKISNQNIKKGVKTTPFKTFISEILSHFFGN